jgi:hypothetical protein
VVGYTPSPPIAIGVGAFEIGFSLAYTPLLLGPYYLAVRMNGFSHDEAIQGSLDGGLESDVW